MAKVIQQSMSAIYLPPNGKFTAASAFQRTVAGATNVTIPGAGDKTPFYGKDAYGNPVNLGSERGTPGTPSLTLQNYLTFTRDSLQKSQIAGKVEYAQVRFHDCVSLDITTGWEFLIHFSNTRMGDITLSDPSSRELGDARIEQDFVANPDAAIMWWKGSITAQTTTETYAANSVYFVSEPDSLADCGNGYPGADKVGFVACDATSGATPNLLYTITGGSTWTACTADPFAASEHADFAVGSIISKTQGRLLVGRTLTDAGAAAEIAYGDYSLSSGDITSWTNVDLTGSTNGSIVTGAIWSAMNPNRVYVAADDGDIYLSTNRGESFAVTYSGSNNIRSFWESADGYIYAVGDTNAILVEKDQSGTFDALTGPTGTNASYAIAVTQDTIWLGNGTSIFYSRNLEPAAAADWNSSKDFGGTYRVEAISPKGQSRVPGGDGQLLHVVANDPAVDGSLWLTADGGGTWEEITNVTNAGYNDAHFSPIDDNLGFMVGEPSGSLALIHKYSA